MGNAVQPVSISSFAEPRVFSPADQTCMIVWDVHHPVWSAPRLETTRGAAPSRQASLRLECENGGTRIIWILRHRRGETSEFHASAGALASEMDIVVDDNCPPAPGAEMLMEGVKAAGRAALCTALVSAWPSILKLKRSRRYTAFVRHLLAVMSDADSVALPVARTGPTVIVETRLRSGSGALDTVHLVSAAGLARLSGAPFVKAARGEGLDCAVLLADIPAISADSFLVLSGQRGLAVRRIEAADPVQSPIDWWQERPHKDEDLRDYLVTELGKRSPASEATALELQLRAPRQVRRLEGSDHLPSAEIEFAISGPEGVLVAGWYRDPPGLVSGLDLAGMADQNKRLVLREFPARLPDERGGHMVTGFVSRSEKPSNKGPVLQPRFDLRLKSGSGHTLVPPPQPVDLNQVRSRILGAMPSSQLTDDILAECLAPALAGVQERLRCRIGEPDVVTIGEPDRRPAVSIIVPLYRVMDFLKTQYAAFAVDPWVRSSAEIIYVLDSPEQAEEVEHLLRGLHLLYAMPVRLAVMRSNAGFSIACNTGAAIARGTTLALINSDVLPITPGWLDELERRIHQGHGAVGPKLLYEDNSLQHAGLYFLQDSRRAWYNNHYFKGMPRGFGPANIEREVPAVTGACLLVARRLFETVGGFTEDYVIGDYEDSDLCLKIRERGHSIVYVPDVELYHLERRSIRVSAEYMRGIASRYNRWLHERRWADVMADLMRGPVGPADDARAAA